MSLVEDPSTVDAFESLVVMAPPASEIIKQEHKVTIRLERSIDTTDNNTVDNLDSAISNERVQYEHRYLMPPPPSFCCAYRAPPLAQLFDEGCIS